MLLLQVSLRSTPFAFFGKKNDMAVFFIVRLVISSCYSFQFLWTWSWLIQLHFIVSKTKNERQNTYMFCGLFWIFPFRSNGDCCVYLSILISMPRKSAKAQAPEIVEFNEVQFGQLKILFASTLKGILETEPEARINLNERFEQLESMMIAHGEMLQQILSRPAMPLVATASVVDEPSLGLRSRISKLSKADLVTLRTTLSKWNGHTSWQSFWLRFLTDLCLSLFSIYFNFSWPSWRPQCSWLPCFVWQDCHSSGRRLPSTYNHQHLSPSYRRYFPASFGTCWHQPQSMLFPSWQGQATTFDQEKILVAYIRQYVVSLFAIYE